MRGRGRGLWAMALTSRAGGATPPPDSESASESAPPNSESSSEFVSESSSEFVSEFVSEAPDVAFAFDGSATRNNWSGSASNSVTLTTANADNIIVVCVHNEKNAGFNAVSGIADTAGLTWTRRKQFQFTSGSGIKNNMEIWWAHAPAALSSDVITVTLDGTTDDATICAFGVTGADVNSPWDANAGLPATLNYTGSNTTPQITGVSTNDPCFLFAFWAGADGSQGATPNAGSGMTLVQRIINNGGDNLSCQTTEYQIHETAAVSNVTVPFSGSISNWGMIVDALRDPYTVP